MKEINVKLGTYEIPKPLIQGGMGIGISLSGLAGAVAKEGGIGIISAAQIGFREPDFEMRPLEANLRAMGLEYEKAKAIAPAGVIGFNIMKAMRHYEKYVKEAVLVGADLIVSGAGVPVDLPDLVEQAEQELPLERRGHTLLAPIVSTAKSASVLLKYWDKKHHRMPDLLVIEGPKAGGHLGFSREQLGEYLPDAYEREVRQILQLVHEYEAAYGCVIRTALGGGISTREDAAKAFFLGVDLIQTATRFVTTEECDADIRYKEAYLKAKKEDIVIVTSPVGMPGRAIRNSFIERVENGEKISHGSCKTCLHKCQPAEIPYCITEALIHAAKGETENALLFCGADAYRANRIETVKEVIDSLV